MERHERSLADHLLMGRPLIIMAMPEESRGLIESHGFDVVYCGVGKVNAAYALTRELARHRHEGNPPAWVLNLGSAGSPVFSAGALVGAHRFVQRDMDATGLGFMHGQTPFDPHPAMLEFAPRFADLRHGICGSGDSFLQGKPPVECEIIDMEAYALAKICHMENVPFACAKFITDGADGCAHTDWQENLRHAGDAFVTLLKAV